MVYRDFQGIKLSGLGFGAMRLPVIDGDDSNIDKPKAFEMVDKAMSEGINYYDTAWGYHNGNSEIVMGEALAKYPRESFYIATKFPGYDLSNMSKVKEIFEKQLEKTGMEYFDFYLFHNVCEMNINQYLDPKFGIFDYLMEQKKNGRIKHLGFSCHGEMETLKRFIDAYGEHMEFCQIQLNYLDWKFQDAKAKVDLLNEKGIPVWVMEPLRGGKLAKLDDKFENELKELRPDEAIPAWAFRFLQSTKGVTMVLSGMSNMQQLEDNIKTFKEDKPLNEKEMAALMSVVDRILERKSIPCTACHYCVSHCPQGLDIPHLISLYNEHFITIEGGGFDFIAPMALSAIPDEKRPASCLHCHSCEQVCPQQIKISDMMSDFVSEIG
ncbi:aldo/keto reductase [Butyrivibrio sp. NC2007]|uniref:aldo/keto reductase n=1 Tax=Butyrivibrio sp. NC2007 TaxID=1280683 RepID=UPI0003B7AA65|nr:aldo/keto reductase [Butyrivibrio sp. NC2007]